MTQDRHKPKGTDPSAPVEPVDFKAIAAELAANAPSRDEDERRVDIEAAERHSRRQRLEDSGVAGAITDDDRKRIVEGGLLPTHSLRTVQRWLRERAKFPRPLTTLALVGLTGRGKTVSAAWLIARLGGIYLTAEQLTRESAARWAREREVFERHLRSRVLVVDDLGTERELDQARGALWDVVNARIGLSRAWTMLTGNLLEAEFRERYGERTIRRIEHQGAIVAARGEDLRRRAWDGKQGVEK